MSLKARIEAVIYASEEPVTLPQLAALFREEALASRAARLAAETAGSIAAAEAVIASEPALAETASLPEATESLDPEVPPIPSSREEPPPSEAEPQIGEPAAKDSADAEVASPDFSGEPQPVPEPTPSDNTEGATQSPEPAALSGEASPVEPETPADPEAEKKANRVRDREVRDEIRGLVDELIAEYSSSDRGLEIREVAGGFRFGTRAEYHDSVRAFVKSLKPPMKLSLQALETLAVIAYKQPVTAPEIGEIRGVDSGGVLGSLVARKLITTAGRKQVIGRPILYKTTKEFLLRFGLKDLNELPSIEEFEKMAGELAETEAEGPIAPGEEELPFAQNEIDRIEENEENPSQDGEESVMQTGPRDPKEPAPPMDEPPPEVPQPPIGEPPTEPDPAPTSEHDARGTHS